MSRTDLVPAGGAQRSLPYALQVCLVAVAYFAAAKISLLLAIPPGYATAVWPSSGIALAATLLLGGAAWPGIWLGATIVNLSVKSSLIAAVFIGTGNTLEALACAALCRRTVGVPRSFERGEDVVRFVVCAGASATIAATIGVGSLAAAGAVERAALSANWWTWWQGDTTGMLIATPLILNWSMRGNFGWTRRLLAELAAFALLLLVIAWLVFTAGTRDQPAFGATFLILPLIIWAAFRFTQREVTTAIAVVCAIAVWKTVGHLEESASGPLNQSLLLLLAFIGTVVFTGLVLSAVVDERRRATAALERTVVELHNQAVTDPLTGLSNRRSLYELLGRELVRARRNATSLAVIMIDLDHFKRINDTLGHDAGDAVLRAVAALLKRHVRGSDLACRYGGEEFILVLPEVAPGDAWHRAEHIRLTIKDLALSHRGAPIPMSASFGVALYPHSGDEVHSLIRGADDALYGAKSRGRDRVVIATARGAGLADAAPGAGVGVAK